MDLTDFITKQIPQNEPSVSTSSKKLISIDVQQLVFLLKQTILELPENVKRQGEKTTFASLKKLIEILHSIRITLDDEDEKVLREAFREQIQPLTNMSKFCQYVLAKPRGYPGDFLAMEMIWRGRVLSDSYRYEGTTEVGRYLNAFTFDLENSEANEYRVSFLADKIMQFAPRSLASIGSGSAIELRSLLQSYFSDRIESIHLFDQDEEALERAKNYLLPVAHKVKCEKGNIIKKLLSSNPATYDFIYSSGMFDYFDNEASKRLISRLWSWVNPGGCLLVTNAKPDNPTKLWMEYGADWYLSYKTTNELKALTDELPEVSQVKIDSDPFNVYQYMLVRKFM